MIGEQLPGRYRPQSFGTMSARLQQRHELRRQFVEAVCFVQAFAESFDLINEPSSISRGAHLLGEVVRVHRVRRSFRHQLVEPMKPADLFQFTAFGKFISQRREIDRRVLRM